MPGAQVASPLRGGPPSRTPQMASALELERAGAHRQQGALLWPYVQREIFIFSGSAWCCLLLPRKQSLTLCPLPAGLLQPPNVELLGSFRTSVLIRVCFKLAVGF